MNLAAYGDGISMGLDGIAEKFESQAAGERANYQLGVYHRDLGEYAQAIEEFEEAVELNDGVVAVLAQGGIGDCHVELGDFEAAVRAFTSAASAGESSSAEAVLAPMFLYKAALAHLELGNTKEAAKLLEEIVEDYPESQQFSTAQVLHASLAS
jgi:tetratricopeptide (TPR) repeat protein